MIFATINCDKLWINVKAWPCHTVFVFSFMQLEPFKFIFSLNAFDFLKRLK